MALKFKASQSVAFESGTVLESGDVQLAYSTKTQASVAAGRLEIPQQFKIAIPFFKNQEPVELVARFRFRISDGVLALFYSLVNPEKARDTYIAELASLLAKETSLPIYTTS